MQVRTYWQLISLCLRVGLDLYAVLFLPHPGELCIFYLYGVCDDEPD